MRTVFRIAVLLAALALSFSTRAQSKRPWAEPAFTASPAALAQEAAAATSGETDDALILLEEGRYEFDAEGRNVYTWRMVYRVLTERGAEGWGSTQVRWQPWHQERPTLRARVVTADGAEHWLDEKTIGEFPVAPGAPDTYHDARILRAPLPAVAVGAVVESEIVVRESAPFFDRGNVRYFYFGGSVPTLESHLVIEAPAELPLNRVARLLPGTEPKREESGGRVRWTYDVGRMEAVPEIDGLVPSEIPQTPYVAFSTGRSWNEIAARYAQIVEEQIAAAKVEPIAKDATKGAKTREEKAARLLDRLRRDVRYTAVEFGAAAIVPRTPGETLTRKYGDCKDQAALYVALLRAAGLEAHVVLLNTGPGPDIEADLPGMGVFDHAIAYLPGNPPLWVDTTHEFARPNQLPLGDQGRQALIAALDTQGLTRTPASSPADNLVVITREFYLTDEGPARVVETSEVSGAPELNYRDFYAHAKPEEIQDGLKGYAQSTFLADDVGSHETTDPRDFSRSFRLKFDMPKSKRAWTQGADVGVAILLPPLFDRLPDVLTEKEAEDEEKKESESRQPKKLTPPDADLVLYEPYITEWRYRIVPTAGVVPRELPKGGTETFGPATLTREFKAGANDSIEVTLRFDTGKRRLTATEVAEMRRGLQKVLEGEPLFIRFENVGEAHLEAGRVREALAEFRRLEEFHPTESLHRTQVARALLAGGLGEAARTEAQRATELDPKSAKAYNTLGWILQHDLIGRRFGKGWDPEGAAAAYRRALELVGDDDNLKLASRADLAILLEHNPEGVRYGPGSRLDEAIAEYKKIEDVEPDAPLFNNLPLALFWAKRFDELKEFLQSKHLPRQLHHAYLAAVAATDGVPAVQREAATLIPAADNRRRILLQAGQMLKDLRLYSPAADLLAAGASAAENPTAVLQQAELIRRLRRHEEMTFPEDDPRSVVKQFFRDVTLARPAEELVAASFTREFDQAMTEDNLKQLDDINRGGRFQLRRQGVNPDLAIDIVLAVTPYSLEGDDAGGYRVRAQNATGGAGAPEVYFVVKEDGRYRLLGTSRSLGFLGKVALQRAEASDWAGARRLLDWAREERPAAGGDDPLAGAAFSRFWTKGEDPGPDATRFAAAALMAGMEETAATALPVLQEGHKQAGEKDRERFDLALAEALTVLERFADALPYAERLLAARPTSERATLLVSGCFARLHRWDDVEKITRQRLERLPDDADALRQLAQIAQRRNDFAEATRLHQRLIDIGKAEAGDYNNIAWQALFDPPVNDAALEAAQRAVMMTNNNAPGILHTLACLYAEAGRTSDAREIALHAMEVQDLEEPSEIYWFIFGRIAEHFGENQSALAVYRRAIPAKPEEDPFLSTTELAQKHIAALESAGKDKPQAKKPKK